MAAEVMAELDEIWPGWRLYEPFGSTVYDHRACIKWCLKRLKLITHRDKKGRPQSRHHWGVQIIASRTDRNECFAHPITPGDPRMEELTRPPRWGAPAVPRGPSASVLAFDLDMPLERVERLLPKCPEGQDPRAWLEDFKRRTGGGQ
jgi:hypothetical protein